MVYVLNSTTNSIAYFQVNRWRDSSFDPNGLAPDRRSSRTGKPSAQTNSFFRAEALVVAPPPDEVEQIQEGMYVAELIQSDIASGVDSEELGLDLPSAVSLLGPFDSPAGLHRNALQNSINNYYNSFWYTITHGLYDLGLRAADRIIGKSNLQQFSTLLVSFPDGSTIQVRLNEWLEGLEGSRAYDMEVLVNSVQVPGLLSVPRSAGQFNGFEYIGQDTTLEELALLAERYGITVTRGGSLPSRPSRFVCEISGGTITCRVIGS
jgi:hypothetical protein